MYVSPIHEEYLARKERARDPALAAEAVRRFHADVSAEFGLGHLHDAVWAPVVGLGPMAIILDGAATLLDDSGDAGEAAFCRRFAKALRDSERDMFLRDFVVEALRCAGFDPKAQVRIAGLFVERQERLIEFPPSLAMDEKAMVRHRRKARLRSSLLGSVLRALGLAGPAAAPTR